MREYRLELRPQRLHHIHADRHYHSMSHVSPKDVLIYRQALSGGPGQLTRPVARASR